MYKYHRYTYGEIFLESNEEMSEEDVQAYAEHVIDHAKVNGWLDTLTGAKLDFDGDYCNITYYRSTDRRVPFMRLRRITGYLVGDVSRWNDGKRAELRDRRPQA